IAADWPQFLGPTRDGHSPETVLAREWTAAGPAKLWDAEIGAGFSGPVVSNGKVLLFHRVDDEDGLQCWSVADGKLLWKFGVATSPLVDAKRIYVNIGSKGAGVIALDRDTGKEVWKATDDEAGYSSPILAKLDGADRLIFLTRDGLLVLDPETGKVLHQR